MAIFGHLLMAKFRGYFLGLLPKVGCTVLPAHFCSVPFFKMPFIVFGYGKKTYKRTVSNFEFECYYLLQYLVPRDTAARLYKHLSVWVRRKNQTLRSTRILLTKVRKYGYLDDYLHPDPTRQAHKVWWRLERALNRANAYSGSRKSRRLYHFTHSILGHAINWDFTRQGNLINHGPPRDSTRFTATIFDGTGRIMGHVEQLVEVVASLIPSNFWEVGNHLARQNFISGSGILALSTFTNAVNNYISDVVSRPTYRPPLRGRQVLPAQRITRTYGRIISMRP